MIFQKCLSHSVSLVDQYTFLIFLNLNIKYMSFEYLYAETGKLDKALVVHPCWRLLMLMCKSPWTGPAAQAHWGLVLIMLNLAHKHGGFMQRCWTGLVTSSTTLCLHKEDTQRSTYFCLPNAGNKSVGHYHLDHAFSVFTYAFPSPLCYPLRLVLRVSISVPMTTWLPQTRLMLSYSKPMRYQPTFWKAGHTCVGLNSVP